jgi:phosphate starvation-inducible PhoH-like protein
LKPQPKPLAFSLTPADNQRLAVLCGEFNAHLKEIEARLGVSIANRGNVFSVSGPADMARQAERVLRALYEVAGGKAGVSAADVHIALQHVPPETHAEEGADIAIRTRKTLVRGRNPRQRDYLRKIMSHDITFGLGPAGTGKTYLAVACATHALENDQVSRIVLTRPAVEAGERLGFLPGDLGQKVDPYLRPLYDALYEMMGFETVERLLERHIIEIAPLAYMRGRTLNEAFIILDEAQNTTAEQMKMFLTRIGFGSTAVITGDMTQTDLPRGVPSGLRQAASVLAAVDGISMIHFKPQDVVRHPLVQKIVEAYEAAENRDES